MKTYKRYKKVEPVCFNFEALLSYIILPLGIASYISYPILYFLGTKATVIFNIILAFVATYFYKGLKRFITILNNNMDDLRFSSVLFRFVSFLIILVVLLIANFGFYLLVVYQKNNEFNIFHFYSWLLILFGLPLLYYIQRLSYYYYVKSSQEIDFVNVILTIDFDLKLFVSIDNIQFVNTLNRKSSDIKIKNNIKYYSQKEFLALKTKNREYYDKKGFRELVQIPLNANLLLLSWFSFAEGKYYTVEIPFLFEKLSVEEEKYLVNNLKVRVKQTKTLQLHFYPNGGIKLFNRDKILIDCPDNKESSISEEYKKLNFLANY
ncbi:hypothetical protein [Flavobacterium piscis]|uniref:Uncharacterized protein n=1 Tax=Flavobacterium piscis TaxID=1114874 RepID=A0ABU1YF86_9FLAO|nr:hypothetical protein [Flavobacterium piscis]MDR7212086.1 hypothetical protein [Flavobacterium piscis]